MAKQIITGLHIVGQLQTRYESNGSSVEAFKTFLSGLLIKYSLQELGSYYYSFGVGSGFTGIVSLTESHIAIHTWPELQYVTLDVYLCNYSRDNKDRCREVFAEVCDYFDPVSIDKQEIIR